MNEISSIHIVSTSIFNSSPRSKAIVFLRIRGEHGIFTYTFTGEDNIIQTNFQHQ